ncbi:hypothetical protein PINS_up005697 [Pythium insidiosum]|nr:hypothetical protein PINS_up005697 [Pythium insidiosum]
MRLAPSLALLSSLVLVAVVSASAVAEDLRVRKSWDAYSTQEKDLYLDAVRTAMASGAHMRFTELTMDTDSLPRLRGTAAEPAWHRKWLLGYENMLRSLDPKFAAVTLPYWDVFEDSAKRLSSRVSCNSIVACSSFLSDLGGCEGQDFGRPYTVNGVFAAGNCVNHSIASAACTAPNERSCERCIPRGDWNLKQSTFEFGPSAVAEVLRHAVRSQTPMETLRQNIASRFHYALHNLLGGVYETGAAAFDPVYIGQYAMADMLYTIQQHCHSDNAAFLSDVLTVGGHEMTSTSVIPMRIEGQDVETHPRTAAFFQNTGRTFADLSAPTRVSTGIAYDYELSGFLKAILEEFGVGCPAQKDTGGLRFAEDQYMPPDREASLGFVRAMATCADTVVTGETDEAPYTFVVCELMAKQQNGVFTNFSSTMRNAWQAPPTLLPTCVTVLQAVAAGVNKVQVSDECRRAFLNETSINTNDFSTKSRGFAVVTRGRDGKMERFAAAKP